MAKNLKSVFFCQNCGYESVKWMGQCPACREWNTFVEEKSRSTGTSGAKNAPRGEKKTPVPIREISSGEEKRTGTGIGELDRVLGGGWII